MNKGCILWLTGVLPNFKKSGLTSGEANELSNIMFEELKRQLYEAVSNQEELSLTGYPPCQKNAENLEFKNQHRNFLVVTNQDFNISDLEVIFNKGNGTIIIFLCKPNAKKESFIAVAQKYNVPFITQKLPQIEWSPRLEELNEEIDHDFRSILNSQYALRNNSPILSFLANLNSEQIKKYVYRVWRKAQPVLHEVLIRLIVECAKGSCQYIGGFCGS